jgi:hypothetical protein
MPAALATGDVDGDHRPDVLVASQREHSVMLLKNVCASQLHWLGK